jgi:hypothetical protein
VFIRRKADRKRLLPIRIGGESTLVHRIQEKWQTAKRVRRCQSDKTEVLFVFKEKR